MSFLDLIYPPDCLHCKTLMQKKQHFCKECLEQFTLLRPEGRCEKCFLSIPTKSGLCKSCHVVNQPIKLISCFDAYGPATSLLNAFMSHSNFPLAKEIAAYIVYQIHQLNLPAFECITMVPNYFLNPQFEVARITSEMLGVPFQKLLTRQLNPTAKFSIKRRCNIINKEVLLLDLKMQTRQIMRESAQALQYGWPKTIYGMTFCAH